MSHVPSNKTLAKAIVVFGGAQTFSVLAGLVRNKVAAETIGAEGVGLNALYLAIAGLLGSIIGLGLGNSAVQRLSSLGEQPQRQREEIGRLRTVEWLLAIVCVALAAIVSPWLSRSYFDDSNHIFEMILVGVVAASYIVSGIETAILKSLGRTKTLASYLLWVAVLSVLFSVPIYCLLGVPGVIWSLMLTYLFSALLAVWMGWGASDVAPQWSLLSNPQGLFRSLSPVIRLGFAFLATGIVAQAVELFIQSMLQQVASLQEVGLYKAGYQMSVTYPAMIFTAIANDFYPRLCALGNDSMERNRLVRQQTQVLLAVVVPLIMLYELIVPWVVTLLLSDEFLPIVTMIRWAALSVILKAVLLPMGYLPLALNKSLHFVLLEVFSWLTLALFIFLGYGLQGFDGIGIGITLSMLVDVLMYGWFVHHHYQYSFAAPAKRAFAVIPYEGLGNRLRAIASAIEVARHEEAPLTIYWNATENCQCLYEDLFEPPLLPEVTLVENPKMTHRLASWRHYLRLPHLLQWLHYDQCLRKFNYWPNNDIYAALKPEGEVLLETCYKMTPNYLPMSEWLRLKPALQQRVDAVVRQFSSMTIGLHVRGTDHLLARQHSTLDRFIARIDQEIAAHPDVRFFLATDEPEVKRQLLVRYPERIITCEAPLRRDTLEGMQAAIVDCFCLSRTCKILGSYNSTYSSLAAEIGGIELEEVVGG